MEQFAFGDFFQLTRKAQEWANELAAGREPYSHSPDAIEGEYGENLNIINDPSPSGDDVVGQWYQERRNYNFKRPFIVKSPLRSRNSHFTALIWYGTRKIGVGKATANDGRTFIVVRFLLINSRQLSRAGNTINMRCISFTFIFPCFRLTTHHREI